MSDGVPPRMDLNEFRNDGWLQEVNRQWFHPRGLALAVDVDEETGEAKALACIYDARDDVEGFLYAPTELDRVKTLAPAAAFERYREHRIMQEGCTDGDSIQPIP